MREIYRVNKNYYAVKCDIKKFFYSIDKNILYNILSKYINDQKILDFSKLILDDGMSKGIPIGNYTSQYFANIYLNELDHYAKDVLRCKYYIRYMDDFIVLVKSKKRAKEVYLLLEDFVKDIVLKVDIFYVIME